MTKFTDGPAKGQVLMLKKCPHFLRVTFGKGKWDALDVPADEPAKYEALFAYELVKQDGNACVNFGGGRGGFYPIAEYRQCVPQPTDFEMRTRERWVKWCEANRPEHLKK